jgi:hypothetical protein
MPHGATTRSALFAGCGGAQGNVKTVLEGIRWPGHQIFVDFSPPVTGTASIMVSSGPLKPPSLSAGIITTHGVMPTHSSSTMTMQPVGMLWTAMALARGAVGAAGFGSGVAQAVASTTTARGAAYLTMVAMERILGRGLRWQNIKIAL